MGKLAESVESLSEIHVRIRRGVLQGNAPETRETGGRGHNSRGVQKLDIGLLDNFARTSDETFRTSCGISRKIGRTPSEAVFLPRRCDSRSIQRRRNNNPRGTTTRKSLFGHRFVQKILPNGTAAPYHVLITIIQTEEHEKAKNQICNLVLYSCRNLGHTHGNPVHRLQRLRKRRHRNYQMSANPRHHTGSRLGRTNSP